MHISAQPNEVALVNDLSDAGLGYGCRSSCRSGLHLRYRGKGIGSLSCGGQGETIRSKLAKSAQGRRADVPMFLYRNLRHLSNTTGFSRFFSAECSPSADPRTRLLAALQQCEIVLVGCPAHPSEGVLCPKKSISHPTNATVAISLISLRTRLKKPRPSVKTAQFVWATPKLTSTSLFSSTERWSKSSVQEGILSGNPEEKADAAANDHAVCSTLGGVVN